MQDLATHEIWRSATAAAITGQRAEEMKTLQDFIKVIHPEDQFRFRSYVKRALKTGRLRPIEYRIIRPDDEIPWLECQAQVIRNANGEPIKVVGLTTDVTERKAIQALLSRQMKQTIQSETRYKQQAALMQSILNHMDEGVIAVDRQGNCLAMNPAAQRMCHCSSLKGPPEQWPHKFGVYRPDRRTLYPASSLPLVQAMRGKSVKAVEILLHPPRQSHDIWICASAGPLHDSEGNLLGGMVVFRDITETKKTEQSLRELSAHQQQAREAERKHIAREIHDELGGSLTALKMAISQYLLENQNASDVKSGKAQSRLTLVETATQSIRRIINDLRPSVLDNFGLWAALEWQAQDFQARTGIQCEFGMQGPEPEVSSERAIEVFRVIQEALTNIVKHANATQVHIQARTNEEAACIQVADNGQGMNKAELLQETSYGILGMRERMQAIGGRLDIMSALAKGTTLAASFPLEQQASPPVP